MRWVFLQVQNECLAVDDLNLIGHMNRGERVIPGDHDAPVRRVGHHFQGFHCVRLQGTMEDQEPGECQAALDLISLEVINLGCPVRHHIIYWEI